MTVGEWARSIPEERERAAFFRTLYLLIESDLAALDPIGRTG